jgi:hypothetical protein
MEKFAKSYVKFMVDSLKKKYKGKYKTPFQMPKEEKDKFFKQLKDEWKATKKAHVKHFESMDKASLNEYFSYYLSEFKIKDIDISFDLDRMDLSMWAEGSKYMYNLRASFPVDTVGEAYLEAYESIPEGGKKSILKQGFPKLKEAVDKIKELEK